MLLARKTLGVGDRALYTIDLAQWLLGVESLVHTGASVTPSTSPPLEADASIISPGVIGVSVSGGVLDESYSVLVNYITELTDDPGTVLRLQTDCIEVNIVLPCEI